MANLSRAKSSEGKAKIDQVLEKIGVIEKDISSLKDGQQSLEKGQQSLEKGQQSLEKGQQSLKGDVQSLKEGQQSNYDLIQKQGIMLEQVASDVKAVAEGHGVLLNAIEGVKESVKELDVKQEETRDVVKETNRMLKEHIRQPAHAVS